MSKATRIRQQNAREKIAAQRAAEKRAEQRRRLFITGGSVLAVIVIVVAFIVVKSMSSPTTTPTSAARTPLPASVTNNITGVPASALASVGKGSVLQFNPAPITKVTGPALTSNGKPEMLYIGAEYCPYCAATRWSMAVALSRFGTLSKPLHGIHSSWGTQERILVCMTPRANAAKMLASGRRNADRFHGELFAIYVMQQDLTDDDLMALDRNVTLARAQHAHVETLHGSDPIKTILEYARGHGITQIFVGHNLRRGWRDRLGGILHEYQHAA